MSRRQVDVVLFLLLGMAWGGSFVAIKYAVAALPSTFCAMLRLVVALAALGAIFLAQGKSLSLPRGRYGAVWLAGFFSQGVPFAFLFWGEKRVSAGLAGVINGTVPLWTFVLGLATGRGERFSPIRTLGLVLGFGGIGIICAPLLRFGGSRGELAGLAAVMVMAICYAVGSLLTRALVSGDAKVDFRANAFHQNLASAALLVAVSAAVDPWPAPRAVLAAPAAVAAILYMGVVSTALAFLIYFHLIREWGPVRASAVTYVSPIFALWWDYLFFGTVAPASELVGVAVVLAGVVLLNAHALFPRLTGPSRASP